MKDLTGKTFGRLKVYGIAGKSKFGHLLWHCKCECGNEKINLSSNLLRGLVFSCGCNKNEKVRLRTTTHGLSKHPLHYIWRGIIRRCSDLSDSQYGGNGVKVCKEWLNDFKPFYNWALLNGWEKGLQIDKDIIPKKLGMPPLLYSPEMCSIVTAKENARNRTNNVLLSCRGVTKTMAEFAEEVNIPLGTISRRLRDGWSIEDAIYRQIKIKKYAKIRRGTNNYKS